MMFKDLKRTRRLEEALGVLIIAGVGMVLNLGGVDIPALRVIFGFLFTFVLPGYALFLLMLRGARSIGDRTLISLGVSLVVDILAAFALHFVPGGLSLVSWTLTLGGITIAASLAVIILTQFDKNEQLAASEGVRVPGEIFRWNWGNMALYGLAILLVIGALILTRNSAAQVNSATFTQFWMMPNDNPERTDIQLGIINQEGKTVDYVVEVKINGQIVDKWPKITVEAGATWRGYPDVPPVKSGTETVEAFLYLVEKPDTVYRWAKFQRGGAK